MTTLWSIDRSHEHILIIGPVPGPILKMSSQVACQFQRAFHATEQTRNCYIRNSENLEIRKAGNPDFRTFRNFRSPISENLISGNLKIRAFGFLVFQISGNRDFQKSEDPDFRISGERDIEFSEASDAGHVEVSGPIEETG